MTTIGYVAIAVFIVGIGISICIYRFMSRPSDELWLNSLMDDIDTGKEIPITIRLSNTDLANLNAGESIIMRGPVIIFPPEVKLHE